MDRRVRIPGLLALLVAAICAGGGAARAGTDIDFGASVRVGDGLFLAISSRCFDSDEAIARQCRERYRNPDDVAVALFLIARSGRGPEVVFSLRREGLSWWEIGRRLEVAPDAWFVPCPHNPGPPYGRAYGYWRRHQHDRRFRFRLDDAEARDLVAVRMLHEFYGMEPSTAMQWRADRRDVRTLLEREYNRRHPRESAREERREERRGRRGHDEGRGRGHGHDKQR